MEEVKFTKTYDTFEDFVENTLKQLEGRFGYSKIRKNQDFLDWINSKKKLCEDSRSTFFDSAMWYRCYHILQTLKQDNDFVLIYLAKPGKGKSTLLAQMCSVINPNYKLDYVCYNYADFEKALRYHQKYDTYHLDEGALIINSMDRGKEANALDKLSAIMRQFNLFIGICFIDFLQMKRHFRDARVNNIILVPQRGKYKYLKEDAVDQLKIWFKSGNSDINKLKFSNGSYFEGHFNKAMPSINDINEASYLERKHKNAEQFLNDLKIKSDKKEVTEEVMSRNLEPTFSARETARILKLSQQTIVDHINKGTIKASKMPGMQKWIITKTEIERLCNNNVKITSN